MTHQKEKLKIPPLKTIDEIISDLDFLKYSTRKRNLAYQINYFDYLTKFLDSYHIYGSLKSSLIRQSIIVATNIIEYLLFISLRQIYGKDPKPNKFPHLVGQARRKSLVGKKLAGQLNKLNKLRDKLHPSKQEEDLDIVRFTYNELHECNYCLTILEEELSCYFKPKQVETNVKFSTYPCEDYHIIFDQCPYCGEQGY